MFKILSKPLIPAILLRHVSVKKRKIRFDTFGSIMTEGQKYTKCAGGCFLYAFSTLPNGTIFGHVWIALFFR